jgi:hypothetical protein
MNWLCCCFRSAVLCSMVGFMCYVMGRLDPSEFFCGLQLTFGTPPHLAQLKQAIEERVVTDGVVPDGGEYGVGDVEILDLRLDAWVPLTSRGQLYSGCFLAAVRDAATSSASGVVDRVAKKPEAVVMGFALEARRLFDALDAESAGALSMRPILKALRHDVNYAIDLFSTLDRRGTGTISFQDFMAAFNERQPAFWHELALRIEHGGKLPGTTGRTSTLFMPAGTYSEQQQRAAERRTTSGGGPAVGRRGSIARLAARDDADADAVIAAAAADVLSSFDASGKETLGEIPSPHLVPLPKLRPDSAKPNASAEGGRFDDEESLAASTTKSASPAGGSYLPPDEASRERARKVVSLLQGNMQRKATSPQPSKIGQRVLSAMRSMRPRAATPPSGSLDSASLLAAPHAAQGPGVSPPVSNSSGPASPVSALGSTARPRR